MNRRRALSTAFGLCGALALLPAGPAAAKIVVHERADDDRGSRLTRSAIARSRPMELPQLPAGAVAASDRTGDGPPRYLDGRPPAGGPLAAASSPDPSAAAFGPFSSGPVAEPGTYPNTTNGRLFGRIAGVGRYSCSATVVRSKNRSVAFTAGHCVRDPRGGWAGELTFVPSYDAGEAPFGAWEWDAVFVRSGWARRGRPSVDYAAIVFRRSGGRKLERAVGSLGFAFNYAARRQTYRPVGYPANKRQGEVMWECISRLGGRDPFHRGRGPAPIGVGCDMLGGSSGGGWSIAGDRLASVTSFGFEGRPDELYGPKLTKKANEMRRAAGRRRVG